MNKKKKGSSLVDAILTATIIVLVVLPVFSFILEGYIFSNKVQVIRDTVDITNSAIVNSLDWGSLGKTGVSFDNSALTGNYMQILAANLHLDANMYPEEQCVLDDRVVIEELCVYTDEFPVSCPLGTRLLRKGVHSVIVFKVKPSLYRRALQLLTGTELIEFKIHTDTELPINN